MGKKTSNVPDKVISLGKTIIEFAKQCVVVAKSCVINEAFASEGPIRMDGAEAVYNDEEIKAHIDELITSVQENIKFLKWRQMKKKIKKMEGDFE